MNYLICLETESSCQFWQEFFHILNQPTFESSNSILKRLVGFALFWLSVGMVIMMFLSDNFLGGTVLVIMCLILAYCHFLQMKKSCISITQDTTL